MKLKKYIHPTNIKDTLIPDDEIIQHIINVMKLFNFILCKKIMNIPVVIGKNHPYPQNCNVKAELFFDKLDDSSKVEIRVWKLLLNDGNIVYEVRIDNVSKIHEDYVGTEIADFDEDIIKFIKKVL